MPSPHVLCAGCVLLAQSSPGAPSDTQTFLLLGLVLLAAALALFAVEMFVPASGTMAGIGAVSLVVGIVLLLWKGGNIGLIAAVVALLASPFVLIAMLRIWPNTPIARMLMLRNPGDEDIYDAAPPASDAETELPPDGPPPARRTRSAAALTNRGSGAEPRGASPLLGAKGTVLTDLRPSGICLIQGQRIECLADGPMIRAGSTVRVVAIDGMQTKVRLEE